MEFFRNEIQEKSRCLCKNSGKNIYIILSEPYYLTVANLAQNLVRLLPLCWIPGGHTIHSSIEGLLPPTDIEPTLFRNSDKTTF